MDIAAIGSGTAGRGGLDLHNSGLTLDDEGVPLTEPSTLQCGNSAVSWWVMPISRLPFSTKQLMKVSAMLTMPFYHPVIEEGVRTALGDLHDNVVNATTEVHPFLECGPGT